MKLKSTMALAAAIALLSLCACSQGGTQSSAVAAQAPVLPASAPQWWEELSWDNPTQLLEGETLKVEIFEPHRARFTLQDPQLKELYENQDTFDAAWKLKFFLQGGGGGCISTPFQGKAQNQGKQKLEELPWSGAKELAVRPGEKKIIFYVRDEAYDFTGITAISAAIDYHQGESTQAYYRVEEGRLAAQEHKDWDVSQKSPLYRYMQVSETNTPTFLTLYGDGSFQMETERDGGKEYQYGSWEDGNSAIELTLAEEAFGPDARCRMNKSNGLRIVEGAPEGFAENGATFRKIGGLLALDTLDGAVVSQVVPGDRPALFLDTQENKALLEAFHKALNGAVKLSQPQWTEDPADRPNLQFDLNCNGEDLCLVLCPCVVDGTGDKYLLVQKESFMGSITYTYYQTWEGDDYDRLMALFQEQHKKTPETLTQAMAVQLRAQTAAISHLDYSQDYPLDANGVPLKFKTVFRNQKATGYWGEGNPWGAGVYAPTTEKSEMRCQAGTVAVRPGQIPYGSKLYIRTPGGGFIYGYAIANDTGSGLMEGIIDVDLFYDTYEESVMNSVRWVDIYILE